MPVRKFKVIPVYKSERITDKGKHEIIGYRVCSLVPWDLMLRRELRELYLTELEAEAASRQARREHLANKAATLCLHRQARYYPADDGVTVNGIVTGERKGDGYPWRSLELVGDKIVAGKEITAKLSRLETHQAHSQVIAMTALGVVEEGLP